MKKIIVALLVCGISFSAFSQKKKTAPAPAYKTEKERVSYLIGYDIAQRIKADFAKQGIEIDNAIFVKGMEDVLTGKPNALPDSIVRETMMAFQQKMMAKQQEKQFAEYDKNKKEGEAFLAENAKKDSVKVTKSGLQYKILKEGTGKVPADTSTVVVHYRGRLINGTVFDESYSRGEPITFQLNGVIKGWTEGLQLMKVGGKAEFYIPEQLAYGERGAGQMIGAGATLIFEVELLEVK